MEHPGFHAHLVLCDAALPGGSAVTRLPGLGAQADRADSDGPVGLTPFVGVIAGLRERERRSRATLA
jgi:hypothetical protein